MQKVLAQNNKKGNFFTGKRCHLHICMALDIFGTCIKNLFLIILDRGKMPLRIVLCEVIHFDSLQCLGPFSGTSQARIFCEVGFTYISQC